MKNDKDSSLRKFTYLDIYMRSLRIITELIYSCLDIKNDKLLESSSTTESKEYAIIFENIERRIGSKDSIERIASEMKCDSSKLDSSNSRKIIKSFREEIMKTGSFPFIFSTIMKPESWVDSLVNFNIKIKIRS